MQLQKLLNNIQNPCHRSPFNFNEDVCHFYVIESILAALHNNNIKFNRNPFGHVLVKSGNINKYFNGPYKQRLSKIQQPISQSTFDTMGSLQSMEAFGVFVCLTHSHATCSLRHENVIAKSRNLAATLSNIVSNKRRAWRRCVK